MAVSPGDEVDLEVWARYDGSIGTNNAQSQASMVTAVAGAFGGLSGGTTEQQAIYDLFNGSAANFFVGSNGNSSQPRAYLNYILFDQDFNYVTAGYDQVTSAASGAHEKLSFATININEGGFLYVYVSNESTDNLDVFFDDLRITHTKGAILQEDTYYPFGMNIQALSSTAPLSKPNRFKYNGKELNEEFGLNWYDYGARNYDAQLGRWFNIDPLADNYTDYSPYNYTANNPILFIDPDGRQIDISDVVQKSPNDAKQLESNLENTSGLQLSVNKQGKLEFAQKKGFLGIKKAVVQRDANGKKIGSRKARRALKKAIKSKDVVTVKFGAGQGNFVPYSNRNLINFDPVEISTLQNAASADLDKNTVGSGMVFMHELRHTTVGGERDDPAQGKQNNKPGATVRKMNRIRRQLGRNYGSRVIYGALPITNSQGGTNYYMPFSRKSLRQLRKGKIPKARYLKF